MASVLAVSRILAFAISTGDRQRDKMEQSEREHLQDVYLLARLCTAAITFREACECSGCSDRSIETRYVWWVAPWTHVDCSIGTGRLVVRADRMELCLIVFGVKRRIGIDGATV